MRHSDSRLDRRSLGRIVAGAAVLPTLARAIGPAAADDAPPAVAVGAGERLRLRRDPGTPVSALDVDLDRLDRGGTTARVAGDVRRTPVLETTGFAMLGVTWRAGSARFRARTRARDGGWSEWRRLPHLHDGPDAGSSEAGPATGGPAHATEAVWTGRATAVQLEIAGAPAGARLCLIDPGRRRRDRRADRSLPRELARAETGAVPKPTLLSRKVWGANPRWRDGTQEIEPTLLQIHVHHTVNSNDYARRDVPALIRGMYRYHTKSLRWADLGYNFLVDRFGRIWVGRKDSGRRLVRGAHTLGFNHKSMGVSAIGNFDEVPPSDAMVAAIVRLAAWRADRYRLRPRGTVRRRSEGSDKFRDGRWVELPVIDGHRDTNDTACPGRHLYAALPRIRRDTAARVRRFRH